MAKKPEPKKAAAKPAATQEATKAARTAVSVPQRFSPEAMVLIQNDVPEYLKGAMDSNRGSEGVNTEDMVIPRLEVIQDLSPQVTSDSPEYNPQAKAGMLTNSVTGELYGTEVFVVNVHFNKQWLVWKDRKQGGGFFGAYQTPSEAEDRADKEGGTEKGVESIDTPTHVVLLLNRNKGALDEMILSMPRTKAKVSRQWNSMIRMAGGDRFTRVYRVTTQREENAKGKFWNYVIAPSGFAGRAVYDYALKLYEQIKGGTRKVVMDSTGFNPGEGGDPADDNKDM